MTAGLRFGRYEALFRVAQGGMAEVFAARIRGEAGFERLVAVKRMLPHLAGDERFVNMFLDEARLAAPLSSPHVVATLDLGRDDEGSPYIVLELVVGASLGALVSRARSSGAPLPLPVALEVLSQTALGLHHAHEARTASGTPLAIVHRDVSPQNVLVGASGTVKVSDFGIAKAAMARLTQTAHGSIKGKIAYLSPEQANAGPVDRRSDVYSLGVVAWEVLAGRRFRRAASDLELLAEVRRPMPAPRLSEVRADLPATLVDAIARALAIDPNHRWSSAGELAEALRTTIPKVDPTWAGPVALARWMRADPPSALLKLEARLREASDEGTSEGLGTDPAFTPADSSPAGATPRSEERSEDALPRSEPVEVVEESTKLLPTPSEVGVAPADVSPAPAPRRAGVWVVAGALATAALGAVITLIVVSDAPEPLPSRAVPPEEVQIPVTTASESPPAVADAPPPEPVPPPQESVVEEEPAATPEAPPARRRRRPPSEPAPRVDRRGPLDLSAFDRGAGR